MKTDRLTIIGLIIAALGWILLIATMVISETVLKVGSLVAIIALRGDILTIAQTTIFSGFALALVGTLKSGFGAFSKFFDAVLQRSAAPKKSETAILDPELVPDAPPPPQPRPAKQPDTITVTATSDRTKPARPKDRNYVVLSDGSVEVETMFGTRVFATLDEARDFIR